MEELARWLCYRLRCDKLVCVLPLIPRPEPEVLEPVDYTVVYEVLAKVCPFGKFYIKDAMYYLTSKKDIERFLEMDPTDREQYLAEVFDCDDFSFRLLGQFTVKPWSGIAKGFAWSETHAFDCFIDNHRVFYVIEPQTDEILSWDQVKDKELYSPLELVVM